MMSMEQLLTALTRNLVGDFNLMTIIGFVMMGAGLAQGRQGRRRMPFALVLMAVGTAIVFAGLYVARPLN